MSITNDFIKAIFDSLTRLHMDFHRQEEFLYVIFHGWRGHPRSLNLFQLEN